MRRDPGLIDRLRAQVPVDHLQVSRVLDEVADALGALHATGAETLFIVGGDGSATGTLSELMRVWPLASLPRIALVPLIILMFGLGDLSKIMTAWVIVFFLVFFNTYEGARSVDRDHINAARLLGASDWQVTRTVIVPSTMAWVFASLTPAVSFSLIGVIVGEFIGAEKGLGKVIIEAEATLESADMMVALLVLMVVGVVLAVVVRRIQAYLLRWQAHFSQLV